MNPGPANILSVVSTAGMGRVDHLTVLESVDVSCHHSVDTWQNCGYGLPVDEPRVLAMLEKGCTVFGDAIYLMADCLDVEIDDVVYESEMGACQQDVDLGWWSLERGSVGASLSKFKGIVQGVLKIEVHLKWQMVPNTSPSWNIQGCYVTTIQGDPTIVNRHMIFPAAGSQILDARYFASGDDHHRYAGTERHPGGVRGTSRDGHQRRSSTACLCRTLRLRSGVVVSDGSPMRVDHVVFCVRHQNQGRAAGLWRALGLSFTEVDLPDLEIRMLIDWNAGIELISPIPDAGEPAAAFTTFLESQGEGLYSVVMAVPAVDTPTAIASRYGADVE